MGMRQQLPLLKPWVLDALPVSIVSSAVMKPHVNCEQGILLYCRQADVFPISCLEHLTLSYTLMSRNTNAHHRINNPSVNPANYFP